MDILKGFQGSEAAAKVGAVAAAAKAAGVDLQATAAAALQKSGGDLKAAAAGIKADLEKAGVNVEKVANDAITEAKNVTGDAAAKVEGVVGDAAAKVEGAAKGTVDAGEPTCLVELFDLPLETYPPFVPDLPSPPSSSPKLPVRSRTPALACKELWTPQERL